MMRTFRSIIEIERDIVGLVLVQSSVSCIVCVLHQKANGFNLGTFGSFL